MTQTAVLGAETPATPLDRRWVLARRWGLVGLVVGLAAFVRLQGVPTDRLGLAGIIIGFLTIVQLGNGWAAWFRMLRDWVPFQGVLLAYDYSRGYASPYTDAQVHAGTYPIRGVHNALGFPLQVEFPIHVDRLLGGGTIPVQWVQEHFHPGTSVPWYGTLVSAVYCTHFLVTPILAIVLWLLHRERFRVWTNMVVLLAIAGLVTYVVAPTAPPWLASSTGVLGGPPVGRYTSEGFEVIGLKMVGAAVGMGQHLVNPVAAMPSLHLAFATLVVGFFWGAVRPRLRPLLLLYPLAMGFALVYGGEHYLTDELAGALYAAVVLTLFRRPLSRAWQQRPEAQVNEARANVSQATRAQANDGRSG